MSDYENQLALQLKLTGHADVVTELRFADGRRFRFDVALPAHQLAVEIDGGCFNGGRHVSAAGIRSEHEKSYLAALYGWRVIHVLPEDVRSGVALARIEKVIRGCGG